MMEKCTWCHSFFPVYPASQAKSWIRYFLFSFHIKKNKYTLWIRYDSHYLHMHSLLVWSHLYPIQHIIPPSILQQCFVYFIHCQWKSRLKIRCQIHFTYLPHMLLDKDGIMMTKVTQTMLNLTLYIILSDAIFTV